MSEKTQMLSGRNPFSLHHLLNPPQLTRRLEWDPGILGNTADHSGMKDVLPQVLCQTKTTEVSGNRKKTTGQ